MSLASPTASRWSRLRGFLEQDPGNAALLADAAGTAIDEGQPKEALAMLSLAESRAPLAPDLLNLKGLAALHAGDLQSAAEAFEALHESGLGGPSVRFNLAAVRIRLGEHEAAAALLDDEVLDSIAGAGPLKVRTLHHLGRLEDALALGAKLAEKVSGDAELMGALASIALDAGRTDLARHYAERAGGSAEGLAADATLLLNDGRVADACAAARRAVEIGPGNARAALGLGTALLATGDARSAIPPLERAAETFGDHPGSWIAAGWAHFLSGHPAAARARFERALACDDNFAESHGALAVVDIADGHIEEAKRRLEVATRLDRNCFSAALARAMLLESKGQEAAAERVRAAAMGTAIDPSGRTLAQALAAMRGGQR